MRNNEPQMLAKILGQAAGLSEIQDQVATVSELGKLVNRLLPAPLNKHIRVANYRNHILVLQASSASWQTRLKYEQSYLLSEVRKHAIPSLSSIQYQIAPDLVKKENSDCVPKTTKEIKPLLMTQESASMLFKLAEQVPEPLKKQLIKLAKHGK